MFKNNVRCTVDEIADYTLIQKLTALKGLQARVFNAASDEGRITTRDFFGVAREVVDESYFSTEISTMHMLLDSIEYSNSLHQNFDNVLRDVAALCREGDVKMGIDSFKQLSIGERLELAEDILNAQKTFFFGSEYPYAASKVQHDPEESRCFARSYTLNVKDKIIRASLINLSAAVVGDEADVSLFLELVFHEGVHDIMYQLQQCYAFGHLSDEDPFYDDAEMRHMYKGMNLFAHFAIASTYPNFLEERLAFLYSIKFTDILGFVQTNEDNLLILNSTNHHKPYQPESGLV